MDFNRDGTLKLWLIPFVSSAEVPFQLTIAGLPQPVAGVNATEVDITVAESKQNGSVKRIAGLALLQSVFEGTPGGLPLKNLIDSPAFFFVFRIPCVEHDSVAGLHGLFQPDEDGISADVDDFSQVDAALLAKAAMHEL